MKWESGRQGTGYFKRTFCSNRIFDLHLLKFPQGSYVPTHVDPVDAKVKHYRANLVIRKAKGGDFVLQKTPTYAIQTSKRFNVFRPDIQQHSVTKIESGTRYALSFGWVVRNTEGSKLLKFLEWVGLTRIDQQGKVRNPFHWPPKHVLMMYIKHGGHKHGSFQRFYIFRNLPGVIKWERGRLLPKRWGFGICGIEFGDRG